MFSLAPSLINMVVMKHKRQIKSMQLHKMSLDKHKHGHTSKHRVDV
jgi:hypothetical protein